MMTSLAKKDGSGGGVVEYWCCVVVQKKKRKSKKRREKNPPLESVSLKLQDSGGSGQEEGNYCLLLLFVLPTYSLHHPQWLSAAPPHIPDPHFPMYSGSHLCSSNIHC